MNGRYPRRLERLAFFLLTALGPLPAPAQNTPGPGAPGQEVVAEVLGKEIREKSNLSDRVIRPLLDQFAKDNGIEATEAEIDAYVDWLGRITKQMEANQKEQIKKLEAELSTGALVENERKLKENSLESLRQSQEFDRKAKEISKGHEDQIREGMRQMARSRVCRWKTFKALHERYGGRVAFQQAGPEPVEALRDFLKEKEQAGAFQIHNPEEAARFWRYFTDPSVHHFFPEAEGKQAIDIPLWRMEKPLGQ